MAESAFEKAFAEEMKGAERDFAVFAWEMNNLRTYADLGRHHLGASRRRTEKTS